MAGDFKFELLTPEKTLFAGKVEALVAIASGEGEAAGGEIGILAGHEPIMVALSVGPVRMKVKGEWRTAGASGGVLVVMRERSYILADSAEWPEDIDLIRAQESRKAAEERLTRASSREEHALAKAALLRAMQRLRLAKTRDATGAT